MMTPRWIVLDRAWDWEHMLHALRKASAEGVADEIERQLLEGPGVVVIDVDEESDVDRVADVIRDASPHGVDWYALHSGLCSLLPTPKPPQPLGLGAVVEDADGNRWVRDEAGGINADCWYLRRVNKYAAYTDIAAVTVLSEGVTP